MEKHSPIDDEHYQNDNNNNNNNNNEKLSSPTQTTQSLNGERSSHEEGEEEKQKTTEAVQQQQQQQQEEEEEEDENENKNKNKNNEKEDDAIVDHYHHGYEAPCFGGPTGNGSSFALDAATYAKEAKNEKKYEELGQKVLDLAGITINGDKPFDMKIHHPLVYRMVLKEGTVGLGESFMLGFWDANDFFALHQFFEKALTGGIEYYFPNNGKDTFNIIKAKLFNAQTKSKSKKVGLQHYDLGNSFFEAMLGKYMQYSCAYWEKTEIRPVMNNKNNNNNNKVKYETVKVPITDLEEAQRTKLEMIAQKLRLNKKKVANPKNKNEEGAASSEVLEVLDVGCGWGGLALYLAEFHHVNVTGITISAEQCKEAKQKVADFCAAYKAKHDGKEFPNKITILCQDYRDSTFDKKFDRIVSVGMFEHVGPKNYKTYFKHMRRLINEEDENAVFMMHTIGSKTTMDSADQWYLKYVFPGGCLPSISNIGKTIEKYFVMEDMHNFGYFYGKTLLAWRGNFLKYWQENPNLPLKLNQEFKNKKKYFNFSSSSNKKKDNNNNNNNNQNQNQNQSGDYTDLENGATQNNNNNNSVSSDGFNQEDREVFFRTFYYYLSSSAGAFLARDLQLWQFVLTPKGMPGYPSVYRP